MQVAPDAGSQINDVIDHIASKLSVPASQLWAVLLRQAKLEGWMDLVEGILLLAFALVGALFVRHSARKTREHPYSSWDMVMACSAIVVFVLFISSLVSFHASVTELANPAYFAARTILKEVR